MRKKTKKTIEECTKVGWKDLPEDILAMIFTRLEHKCLFKTAYSVCHSWRSICRRMLFWKKRDGILDFSPLKDVGILDFSPLKDLAVDEVHQFMRLLKIILDELQHKFESVAHICFPTCLYLSDDQICYVAQRLPKVECVILPYTHKITALGFSRALGHWKDLTSLYISHFSDYAPIIQEVGISCKNLEVLKIYTENIQLDAKDGNTFVLDEYSALEIANNLHNVKTLFFHRCLLYKSGIEILMRKCTSLEAILILCCKHATRIPKFHRTLKGVVSYMVLKKDLYNSSVEWFIQGRDDTYRSIPGVLKYKWSFEAEENAPVELLIR